MPRRRLLAPMAAGMLLLLSSGSLTSARAASCTEGSAERLVVEMLFGRNIGSRVGVSQKAFRRFVDQEITSRFPDGFTLLDTIGQFRAPGSRSIVREPGKQIVIALTDEVRDLPRVREVVETYKSRFNQHSVAVISHRSCVAF